jgi:ABC-type lipopolysaccharide export system ATPase subunit
MTDRITLDHLIKKYGQRTVVRGVSADVNRGEVVGLLGPNGAGKTTTFYMVVGLVRPDSGTVTLERDGVARDITRRCTSARAPASATSRKRTRSSASSPSATTCA